MKYIHSFSSHDGEEEKIENIPFLFSYIKKKYYFCGLINKTMD